MQPKTILILVVATATISAGLTRFYWPAIETQTVEVTKEVVRTDIRTVTRLIERPDGTKESVTETIDRSTKHESNTSSSTVYARKDWFLGIGASTELKRLEPVYNVQINRRILGPFYVGAQATTRGSIGLNLGMEF